MIAFVYIDIDYVLKQKSSYGIVGKEELICPISTWFKVLLDLVPLLPLGIIPMLPCRVLLRPSLRLQIDIQV